MGFGHWDRTFRRLPKCNRKGLVESGNSKFFCVTVHRKSSRTDGSAEWKLMLLAPSYLNDRCKRKAEKDLSMSCKRTQLAFALNLSWSPAINKVYGKPGNTKEQTCQHILTYWYKRRHKIGSPLVSKRKLPHQKIVSNGVCGVKPAVPVLPSSRWAIKSPEVIKIPWQLLQVQKCSA